ncbi:elongator complex protein 6 isoform X1 [Hemiscyllium ocellatum]|uniref:elongator complex protein 6 isoform X1 n=1 Tax=Hemiscyllium ocellatum TaxID=170820 RepID=UPI002966F414|nr:elongator complex protein 6 isoform X1 [Hemiscyllium ocellatum]
MFPELNDILGTTPETCEQGKAVLLCDKQTDGSFLVHHFLSFYLKGNCKVCFLGLVQSFNHYSLVAQKLGIQLSTAREKGQLVFLEGLRSSLDSVLTEQQDSRSPTLSPFEFLSSPDTSLNCLYEFVRVSLSETNESTWKFPVLIIDDLSVLLSLGVSAVNILNFMHYCRATICSKFMGNIVMLVHNTEDLEDEENNFVVKSLSHQCHLILQVEGLTTGYCKDIHGQLTMTYRSPSPVKTERNITKIFQYKIQDKNVNFFARGTSSSVL